MKSLLEEHIASDPNNMLRFQQERAIYKVTELLEQAMNDAGVGRTALARRLGKTKAWVTQLLDGEGNKTIRTIANVLAVLGKELRVSAADISIGGRLPADAVFRMADYDPARHSEASSSTTEIDELAIN
jgi:hypothetical protein